MMAEGRPEFSIGCRFWTNDPKFDSNCTLMRELVCEKKRCSMRQTEDEFRMSKARADELNRKRMLRNEGVKTE